MKTHRKTVVLNSIMARVVAVAALSALAGTTASAALVTMTVTDAAGTTSFNTGLHWSDSNPPSAGNSYTVTSTAASISLRTPASQATDITFAGDNLTLAGTAAINSALVIKNLTLVNTIVNNLTLNGGQIQNGGDGAGLGTNITLTSNSITIGANGGFINAGAGGRTLSIAGPISGAGPLTVTTNGGVANVNGNITTTSTLTVNANGGLATLIGTNTYTGATTLNGSTISNGGIAGAVRGNDGTSISSTGNLTLNGGVLEGTVDITRALGTGAGQLQITGGVSGFSTVASAVNVSIGGAGTPTNLTWGGATFAPTFLVLNDANAANTLTFANAIDIGTAARTIFCQAGTANVTGAITGTTGGLNVYGGGTLILSSASNSFTGASIIGSSANNTTQAIAGVVRAAASNALGTGGITIGNGGNATTGRLELIGGSTLSNAITLPGRTASVAIQNISGTNELSGTISPTSGGAAYVIQSDGGSLTLSGASAGAGGYAIQSATGARTVTLQGAGSGTVSGIIRDSNAVSGATIAITKAGAGSWTLSNTNTYSGATTVSGGSLLITGSIASSAVTVNGTGALLGGSGTSGAVTLTSGTVSPGLPTGATTSVFNSGNVTMNAALGTYAVDLNGLTAGTGYDQLKVTGTVTLGVIPAAPTLAVTLGFLPTLGDSFTIISNDNATPVLDPVVGTFVSGATVTTTYGAQPVTFAINYAGNDGNDVVLTAILVPEPTTLAALGMGTLLLRRRRAI